MLNGHGVRNVRARAALGRLVWSALFATVLTSTCFAQDQGGETVADTRVNTTTQKPKAVQDSKGGETPDVGLAASPGSVLGQIESDREAHQRAGRKSFFEAARERLGKRHRLSLHGDYNVLYQTLSQAEEPDTAFSGVARFYGAWSPRGLEGTNPNALIFKLENRHNLGDTIPNKFLMPRNGVAGLSGPAFSDAGTVVTNLYWHQSGLGDHFGYAIGIVDVTDWLDVYALVSSWTDFNQLQFSTSPTIPSPNQGLGGALRYSFTPNLYLIAGLADANGDPQHPEDLFDSFFDVGEYFRHVEFGWVGSWNKRYSDNIHVSYWEQDERMGEGVPEGKGAAASFSRSVGEGWQVFLRGGYSDGGGAILARSISAGFGHRFQGGNNFAGFGAGWGKAPGEDGEGTGPVDQYIMESYFRWQPYPALQIVPSLQLILNPALNPDLDRLFAAGLRMRLVF